MWRPSIAASVGAIRGLNVFMRILDRLEEILIAALMAAATLLIFVAVVHRYAVGVPFLYPFFSPIHLSWAQELCIYMFVWMAKFGAAYGVRTGIHVGVDVLVNLLRPEIRKWVILFGLLGGVLFTAVKNAPHSSPNITTILRQGDLSWFTTTSTPTWMPVRTP